MPDDTSIERLRHALLDHFEGFLGNHAPEQLVAFRSSVWKLLEATPEAEIKAIVDRVAHTGEEWGYFPPEPFARDVDRVLGDVTLASDSAVVNAERIEAVRGRPLVLLPNHISYSDANLVEILFYRAGLRDISERMTVLAGPKVYSDPLRRFLSLCFGTIKTAQSTQRSSGEAALPAREVAAIARRTIELAYERLAAGDALLIFAEGSRSRDATMQPLLAAVARYLEAEGSVLVPIGITGTERLIGVEDNQLHPTRVVIHIGEPIEASDLLARTSRKRPAMIESIGRAIALALPQAYRGVYA